LVVIVREVKNPSWFQANNKEGFFASRGGLTMSTFVRFLHTIQPQHKSWIIKFPFAAEGLDF
jgi:hypothetical protein